MSDISHWFTGVQEFIVETNEDIPKPVVTISTDNIISAEGYQVRIKQVKEENKKGTD